MFQDKDLHICFVCKLCHGDNQSLIHILVYNLYKDHPDSPICKYKFLLNTLRLVRTGMDCMDRFLQALGLFFESCG